MSYQSAPREEEEVKEEEKEEEKEEVKEGEEYIKVMDIIGDPSGMCEVLVFLSDEAIHLEDKKKALNVTDRKGVTPLFVAIRKNADYQLIEKMVEIGGEDLVNKKLNIGETILHEAAKLVLSYEIFKLLIDTATTTNNEPLFVTDYFGNTPLHHGTSYGMLLNIALLNDIFSFFF